MRIFIVDNYDSFTYNLVHLVALYTEDITVARNDKVTVGEIENSGIDRIIISPGPGRPESACVSIDIVEKLSARYPILGVCLGHQVIGYRAGSEIVNAPELKHGKVSPIVHDGKTIFAGLPQNFAAGRYHSLIIEEGSLPSEFEVSARTEDGTIMGIRHRSKPLEGIQFHPESILTPLGPQIMKNWLDLYVIL